MYCSPRGTLPSMEIHQTLQIPEGMREQTAREFERAAHEPRAREARAPEMLQRRANGCCHQQWRWETPMKLRTTQQKKAKQRLARLEAAPEREGKWEAECRHQGPSGRLQAHLWGFQMTRPERPGEPPTQLLRREEAPKQTEKTKPQSQNDPKQRKHCPSGE